MQHTKMAANAEIKRKESKQGSSHSAANGHRRRERRPSNSTNASASSWAASASSGGKVPPSPGALSRSSASSRSRHRTRSKSPAPSRARSKSASRARSRSPARGSGASVSSRARSRSRSRQPPRKAPPRKEHDTPFDPKGRCHYHADVQLAKKKLTGGWKTLLPACPKCVEDKYINDDNRSVASHRSTRSSRSVRSTGSRSVRSVGSRGRKNREAQYDCPFDNRGFCHRHSHVMLAKRKLIGGWKILQEFCLECAEEDNRSVDSRSSKMSRKSTASRRSTSSRKSSGRKSARRRSFSSAGDETASQQSSVQSEEKEKTKVRKMRYKDDDGEEGRYSGYVNGESKPHGRGKCVYDNGSTFKGEWCEGSKVHGKTSRGKSKKSTERGKEKEKAGGKYNTVRSGGEKAPPEKKVNEKKKQEALKQYKELYNTEAPVVKNMIFVDFYGDKGRYTGEVNDKKLPHGVGQITYDHGLVQEGKWVDGVLDEDTSVMSGATRQAGNVSSEGRRRSRSKDP